MFSKLRAVSVAMALVALFALPCMADTYNFGGGFNYAGFSDWTYNQPFSGVFDYDPASGLGSLSLTTNGFNWSGAVTIGAFDNYGPGHDTVFVHNSDWSVYLQLASNANLFNGAVLPAALNFGAFDYQHFLYVIDPNYNEGIGDLTSLTECPSAVPIPPSALLMGSGLVAMVGFRRKNILNWFRA